MKKVRHWWQFETRLHSHQAVVGVVVTVHSLLILVDWRQERCWKPSQTPKDCIVEVLVGRMKKVRHWWRFETRFHSHQAVVGVVVLSCRSIDFDFG